MRSTTRFGWALPICAIAAGVAGPRAALGATLTYIDVPGEAVTFTRGINDAELLVGDTSSAKGFIKDASGYTQFNAPGGTSTVVADINNLGEIVGESRSGAVVHGFVRVGMTYTAFDYPGAAGSTFVSGNNDLGQIVGVFRIGASNEGYLKDGATFTALHAPFFGTISTTPGGINNLGQVVGTFEDGSKPNGRGFLKTGSTYTSFDINLPGVTGTRPEGINDRGLIAGNYFTASGSHGFVKDGTAVLTIDVPGASDTFATDINASGVVSGYYFTPGHYGSFIIAVPEPSGVVLLALAAAPALLRRRAGPSNPAKP